MMTLNEAAAIPVYEATIYRVVAFNRDDARVTGIEQATRDGRHVIDADVRKVRGETIMWDVRVRHMVYR